MTVKILCPFHMEDTPSMVIYEDYGHCFGCGARAHVSKLPEAGLAHGYTQNQAENISKSLKVIDALPRQVIRGFEFPADSGGYYLVFPNAEYYIKRTWGSGESKYLSPKGHRKPMFVPGVNNPAKPLFIVEGQINALTLSHCFNEVSIVSPGAATDLNRREFMHYYLQYTEICIIVDKDPAGVVAGLQLKRSLLKAGKRVLLYAMEKDLNDVYCEQGKDAVVHHAKEAIRLL